MLTSALVHDVSTYQTSWVSSPDLIMLRLQYLPVYKVFRCTRCMASTNPKAPKGCIHPAKLAKHLLSYHDSKHSLEEIQQQIDRLSSNHPPHESLHPLIPFFPSGILPPAIPGVAREIGFYCTLCKKVHKGDNKVGYSKLITHCNKEHPNDWKLQSRYHFAKICMGRESLFFSNRSRPLKPVRSGNFLSPIDPSRFALSTGAMHGCIA